MHFTRTQYYKYGLDHIFRLSVLVRYVICGKNSGNLSFHKSHAPLLKVSCSGYVFPSAKLSQHQNILSFAYLCQDVASSEIPFNFALQIQKNNIEANRGGLPDVDKFMCRICFGFWFLVQSLQMYFPFPTWTVGIRFQEYSSRQMAHGSLQYYQYYLHYFINTTILVQRPLNAQYKLYSTAVCAQFKT
ncbi:Hypothetical_protein [Hexamita inflata]|uniref:Hypothetical_protein n=1 Tax=Hexamita inflata TaxID=28002 RepID=A0AA86NWF8_9EUKA|nr:Hypothetical protein HINF_LOCUS14348 [Hexamita inflata]